MNTYGFVVTPFLEPLLAFARSYGMMVLGAMLVLAGIRASRLGPISFLILVIGLGIVVAGIARVSS